MRIRSEQHEELPVNAERVEQVASFIYIGSTVNKDERIEKYVRNLIPKGIGVVQLYPVLRNNNISQQTNLSLSIAT